MTTAPAATGTRLRSVFSWSNPASHWSQMQNDSQSATPWEPYLCSTDPKECDAPAKGDGYRDPHVWTRAARIGKCLGRSRSRLDRLTQWVSCWRLLQDWCLFASEGQRREDHAGMPCWSCFKNNTMEFLLPRRVKDIRMTGYLKYLDIFQCKGGVHVQVLLFLIKNQTKQFHCYGSIRFFGSLCSSSSGDSEMKHLKLCSNLKFYQSKSCNLNKIYKLQRESHLEFSIFASNGFFLVKISCPAVSATKVPWAVGFPPKSQLHLENSIRQGLWD